MDYLDDQPIGMMSEDELNDLADEEAGESDRGQVREEELQRVDSEAMIWFLSLSGIAIFLPFVVHLPLLTGPIINAILILILFIVGLRSALVVALIPSIMALAGGLLPVVLAPVVPFIMVSNLLFVITIYGLYHRLDNSQKGYWIGVVAGAALKFVFLLWSVEFVSRLVIKKELAAKVAQMMSWPQFATAVAGGVIAWAVLKFLKKF
ncbi:hypothetical protein HGA64_01525 [Candidatus Falkowbacteria bacterium]|nr:hypothetical protein [Candidatus Falkowbacteria bacterium]